MTPGLTPKGVRPDPSYRGCLRLWGVIFLFAREASKVGVLSMVGMVAGVAVALCGL